MMIGDIGLLVWATLYIFCPQWRRNEFESGGHVQEKFFVVLSTSLALQVQLVVLMSVFMMVITVWSGSLLFFYSRYPVPSHL